LSAIHGPLPGDRGDRKGAVKGVLKIEIHSRQEKGGSEEIDRVFPVTVSLDHHPEAVEEKGNKQREIFKRVEPDKRGKQKAAEKELSFGKNRRKTENPDDNQ